MGGVALEVEAGLFVGDGLAVALQLGQVHVEGGAAVGQVRVQAHHPQRRLRATRRLLLNIQLVQHHDCKHDCTI